MHAPVGVLAGSSTSYLGFGGSEEPDTRQPPKIWRPSSLLLHRQHPRAATNSQKNLRQDDTTGGQYYDILVIILIVILYDSCSIGSYHCHHS